MSTDEKYSTGDSSWESRVLCSDESCIGVIGPDGRCKECGKPFVGELPSGFARHGTDQPVHAADEQEAVASPSGQADALEEDQQEEGDAADNDDWDRRRLCSDENCIGVIGPDGRCKECGKPG